MERDGLCYWPMLRWWHLRRKEEEWTTLRSTYTRYVWENIEPEYGDISYWTGVLGDPKFRKLEICIWQLPHPRADLSLREHPVFSALVEKSDDRKYVCGSQARQPSDGKFRVFLGSVKTCCSILFSGKFLLLESGILGLRIHNPSQGIQNSANYRNPDFKIHW